MYYYQQLLALIQINFLLAVAASLPFATGLLILDLGVSFGVGAITAAMLVSNLNLSILAAALIGALAGAAAASITAVLCRNLSGFTFAISTLAIGELSRVVVTNSDRLGGALGYRNVRVISSAISLALVVLSTLIVLGLFERSAMRKAFRIIRTNENMATTIGISVSRHRFIAVAAGGFWAGLAGAFYIHNFGILEPRMFGFDFSMVIVMYAIIGGEKTFIGPMAAALFLTVVPELLRFSSSLRMVLYGSVLVAVMVFWPEGIFSSKGPTVRKAI